MPSVTVSKIVALRMKLHPVFLSLHRNDKTENMYLVADARKAALTPR